MPVHLRPTYESERIGTASGPPPVVFETDRHQRTKERIVCLDEPYGAIQAKATASRRSARVWPDHSYVRSVEIHRSLGRVLLSMDSADAFTM